MGECLNANGKKLFEKRIDVIGVRDGVLGVSFWVEFVCDRVFR